jgi:hypothetical protein
MLEHVRLGFGAPIAATAALPAAALTMRPGMGGQGVTLMSAAAVNVKRRTFPLLSTATAAGRGAQAEESSADFMTGMLQSLVLQHQQQQQQQQASMLSPQRALQGGGADAFSADSSNTETPMQQRTLGIHLNSSSSGGGHNRRSNGQKDPFSPTDSPLRLLFERSPGPSAENSPLDLSVNRRANGHNGGGGGSSGQRRRQSETALPSGRCSSGGYGQPADSRIRPAQGRRRALQMDLEAAAVAQATAAVAAEAAASTVANAAAAAPHQYQNDVNSARLPLTTDSLELHPAASDYSGGNGGGTVGGEGVDLRDSPQHYGHDDAHATGPLMSVDLRAEFCSEAVLLDVGNGSGHGTTGGGGTSCDVHGSGAELAALLLASSATQMTVLPQPHLM